MTNGLEQSLGYLGQCELILGAFFAVDGDEIDFPIRVNPRWNRVWQRFASGDFHGKASAARAGTPRCDVLDRVRAGETNRAAHARESPRTLRPSEGGADGAARRPYHTKPIFTSPRFPAFSDPVRTRWPGWLP